MDYVSSLQKKLLVLEQENEQLQQQIQNQKLLLNSIGNHLPEGFIYQLITNESGLRKFTFLGSSFQKIYGLSPEEALKDASVVFNRVHKADRAILKAAEINALKNRSSFNCEIRMQNPDGSWRNARFMSTPTLLEDGSISWDGLELDITDLKKAQVDLQQNQFLLESIAEGLPDHIFAKDLQGRFLFVNSAIAKRANKTAQELLGQDSSAVFKQEDSKKIRKKDQEIISEGKTQTFVEQLNSPTERIIFLTTKGPIKDATGNTIGLFGIARDITKDTEAAEALKVSQQKFKFSFDSSPHAILIQDEESRKYIEANASASTIFGYSQEEFLSNATLEKNLYKSVADQIKIHNAFLKNGFIRNREVVGKHKSGEDLHLILTAERHYNNNTPLIFINIQDVTHRKKIELELQKLNLDKDRFISILGHDLRGPVNSIAGLIDILKDNLNELSPQESIELLHLADQSAKRTSKLLDDVLLWSMAKGGSLHFDPENLNLREAFQATLELFQYAATSKKLEFKLLCEPELQIYADKSMLHTILRNLISNAIKFTPEKGEIQLAAQKTTTSTIFWVQDKGVGIEPADLEKIFDKAQLFTSIGTNSEKGSGFGLKLCQEFIEIHNGKIWVESQKGLGTTFFVSLLDK